MEGFSCLISDMLDCIGYNQEIIKVRRDFWQHEARLNNNDLKGMTCKTVGSKAEGITSYCESDIDVMYIFNDSICIDDIENLPRVSDITVLQADTSKTPVGYTRLRLINYNETALSWNIISESLFESEDKEMYVSSSIFASNALHVMKSTDIADMHIGELSGPAVQSVSAHTNSVDNVFAFPCYHPNFLQTWKSKHRPYNWPPTDVRDAASSMLAQLVPVGSKGTCNQWREWRFCFIESELKLTLSLNETQIKLYVLLKMVAKDIFKNVNTGMSSYIMKNVTFWLSELLPENLFRKENLLSLLLLSLRFLHSCITHWNWLPYYIIPGRNLLQGRFSHGCKRLISDLIEILIAEGPRIIFRCTKLRRALAVSFSSPRQLVDFKIRRDTVEILTYLERLISVEKENQPIISRVFDLKLQLLLPELEIFHVSCLLSGTLKRLLKERFRSILS